MREIIGGRVVEVQVRFSDGRDPSERTKGVIQSEGVGRENGVAS